MFGHSHHTACSVTEAPETSYAEFSCLPASAKWLDQMPWVRTS